MAVLMADPMPMAALDESILTEFRGRLRGKSFAPDDPGYDEARAVRNGLIDRHPVLIARCSGTADVVECVNFAREHDLQLSVRGGAHNVAGNAVNDGGLVIDLSGMRGVHVDPTACTVRAQGGATWGDVDRETQLYGLAVPGGVISSTGIAGLTLHGGVGWLRRTYGLSLDNLRSVEIVTANGQVRTASATENAELFWAVRGAGSNFGVITSFEFQAHPVGPMVALAAPAYALEDAARVIPAWRDFMASAPDTISSHALFWSVPAAEMFPPELHGRAVVIPATVYSGPAAEGEQALRPLRELAEPVLDLSGTMPYTALQSGFDWAFPKGWLYYWKSLYLNALDDDAITEIIHLAAERPSPQSLIALWHHGGAMTHVGPAETAFGSRAAPYLISFDTTWTDPEETDRAIAWTRDAWRSMHRFSDGGLYLNFPGFGEEKDALVRAGYGANYDRLVALKTEYDPDNLFRMNLNIPPRV
jgi:FAD/FMN-containing dehydrogenase